MMRQLLWTGNMSSEILGLPTINEKDRCCWMPSSMLDIQQAIPIGKRRKVAAPTASGDLMELSARVFAIKHAIEHAEQR